MKTKRINTLSFLFYTTLSFLSDKKYILSSLYPTCKMHGYLIVVVYYNMKHFNFKIYFLLLNVI